MLTVNQHGNTAINGNVNVDGIMNTTKINSTNNVWNNCPLAITNTGANWFQREYIAAANEVGCLLNTKRAVLQHLGGVVCGDLVRMILTYGLIGKGYQSNQTVVLP